VTTAIRCSVSATVELCRMLLEDRARSGSVTLTVCRQSPDHRATASDSVGAAPEAVQDQGNRHVDVRC